MTVEVARKRVIQRPWGVDNPGAWLKCDPTDARIGEIWFERSAVPAVEPALLLKLLFSSQPLSIQVHPDDGYARSKGLPNGKTEAWHVLSAEPGASVALGLNQRLTAPQLRDAVRDGTVSDLVLWKGVSAGETFFVPAGTIHAIGAGLVIAEIQQRSDATYRLFDHGRQRELHVADAIAVANIGPAKPLAPPTRFTDERTILVRSPYFVFERIELPANMPWCLEAEAETWLLVLSGTMIAGSFDLSQGDAIFAASDRVDIRVGRQGVVALAAYSGNKPAPNLLQRSRPAELARPTSLEQRHPSGAVISSQPAPADRHSGLS